MRSDISLCDSCAFRGPNNGFGMRLATCAAYPKGIPSKFISGLQQHLDSQGDDNGYAYEPAIGLEDSLAAYIGFWYQPADLANDVGAGGA